MWVAYTKKSTGTTWIIPIARLKGVGLQISDVGEHDILLEVGDGESFKITSDEPDVAVNAFSVWLDDGARDGSVFVFR